MTKLRRVVILVYDGAELLDFCGPYEVFSVASRQTEPPLLEVQTVAEQSPVASHNGLSVNPDYLLDDCPQPDLLLVSGGIGSRTLINNGPLIDWIASVSRGAELTMSVCTGALLLGKAGILDGLEATTHHVAYDALREVAPTAIVHEGRRFVDNGRVITSAGITTGIDMSLHVVSRLFGRSMAAATAKHMEYPWQELEDCGGSTR